MAHYRRVQINVQNDNSLCPSFCKYWGNRISSFTDKNQCGIGCLLKVVVYGLFAFVVTLIIIKAGLVDYSWDTILYISRQVTSTKDPSIAISSWITTFATIGALICAGLAYKHSLKARKSASFSSLFAQLLGNHKLIFENKALEKKVLSSTKKTSAPYLGINLNDDLFTSFFYYYKMRHNTLIPIPGKAATSNITTVWDDFVNSLKEESKFSNCFKYVYHEIKTVLIEESLNTEEKKHYLGVIQANMNYDELFCYFINLLQHFSRTKEKEDDFLRNLYDSNFFENIMNRPDLKYSVYIEDLKRSAVGDIVCKIVGK